MRFFLASVKVEGFRGINNESDPLELTFKPECVNSIFAVNAVGKSSIFEALCYAIRGVVPKLATGSIRWGLLLSTSSFNRMMGLLRPYQFALSVIQVDREPSQAPPVTLILRSYYRVSMKISRSLTIEHSKILSTARL